MCRKMNTEGDHGPPGMDSGGYGLGRVGATTVTVAPSASWTCPADPGTGGELGGTGGRRWRGEPGGTGGRR